jgi:two-component system nitrate/nitrite response regulator NarP
MPRLLIADDHPIILSGLEAILRDTGYEIVGCVRDGTQVVAAIETCAPEILLLDVSMAPMGGIEVLRRLRERGDAVRIVLLTAGMDDADLLQAVRLGVDGIVLKESAHAQLLKALEAVCAGGRSIEPELLQRALDLSLAGPAADPLAKLSSREKAIVGLVMHGSPNREIAAQLAMSEGSVKVYLHRIYRKLGVANRTELAIRASRPRWDEQESRKAELPKA